MEISWPLLRAAADAGLRDPALYTRIAGMLHADGRHKQAEAYYRQSLDMDGNQFEALIGLARLLDLTGREEEARQIRLRAVVLSPRQAAKNR